MSGRVMKGFLVFTVVFFFAVVGLVGLTVVMKRHENAQIAEEDKTLVAPDTQKIQRLVDRIEFNDAVPENERVSATIGAKALLKACPRIVNLAGLEEHLTISLAERFPGLDKTKAQFFVMIHFTGKGIQDIPIDLRAEEGYAGFGIGGGAVPGVYILWPFSRWLCNVPSKMTYHEMNEALDKKEVTYKDLIQFIPLKDIPPNSF